ncbi:hypothetical protein DDE20_08560 [Pararhodobacter oceanensis]|uniref:Uncharacterized protein n=1 Tax=Pararhodobacter oceanensis TaxID=2172121 RepID=A0A2T8HUE5_9RHOB|nr:hypothetical protein DDE20_08560 [Pararhodobacter oceanensis]
MIARGLPLAQDLRRFTGLGARDCGGVAAGVRGLVSGGGCQGTPERGEKTDFQAAPETLAGWRG